MPVFRDYLRNQQLFRTEHAPRSSLILVKVFNSARSCRPKGKGKGHPGTGHEGPEGEQIYSSTLSLTLTLDGGGWSAPRPGRFTPGKDPVPIVQEARWATGPGLDGCGKSSTHRDSIPGSSSP